MLTFCHLHNHTQYSTLDGLCKIPETLDRVVQLGFQYYAITDHGNMHGVIEFYQEAKKRNINPIIGSEFYIASGPRGEKTKESLIYHLVLIAKNYTGYLNLLKLSSIGYLEGFYYKPRIDKEVLAQHSDGLFCLSGCLKGEIAQAVLNKNKDAFLNAIKYYTNVFGDRFFLEIQNHGIPEEDIVRDALIKYHKKTNIGIVATNDVHYLNKGDHHSHDVLLCIQTGKKLSDEHRMKYSTQELYLKSTDEMYAAFKDCTVALENTVKIAEQCSVEIPIGQNLLPKFPVKKNETVESVLIANIIAGVNKRGLNIDDVRDRLNYEYKTITKLGFASYFLIVQDFVKYAKESGIATGGCRGSVGGSLVAYLLGITEINPLDYNLLFERFLNPDRISMPDIDMDFADRDRQKVIDYVTEKYGKDSVSQIVTFGTMGPRAVIRDVGRVMGYPVSATDTLAKMVDPKNSLQEELDKNRHFKTIMNGYGDLCGHSLKLEDINRHASIHAAGIIISPDKIINYCPLMLGKNGEIASQYDMKATEALGLLKMDFLGLRTLSVIDDVCKMVDVDINKIPINDDQTYDLFCKGNTVGIFQFESGGMRDYLKKLQPHSIEDLAIMNALYRPGPLDAGMVDVYMRRRAGKEKVSYLHPAMEASLKRTYGILVYQEQVMQVVRDLAGFTLAQADTLRKAIGKKNKELLLQQKELFINGCTKNNIQKEVSEKIFGQIETFARYGFNKSHAIGYSALAYQTGYLKAHYPVEFMAALLTSEIGDISRIAEILYECKKMNVDILPPDINLSKKHFCPEGNKIRFALNSIRNVGEDLCDEIEKYQPYSSIVDFCTKIDISKLNSRKLESLINAGCFDKFGPRLAHCKVVDDVLMLGRASAKIYLQFPPNINVGNQEYTLEEISDKEFDALGLYLLTNPLDQYGALEAIEYTPSTKLQDTSETVTCIGIVTEIKEKTDKNKKKMATCQLVDHYGHYSVLIFSSVLEKQPVSKKDILIIRGRFNLGKIVAKEITKVIL